MYFLDKGFFPAQLGSYVLDPDNCIYNIINSKETFFPMFIVWIKKHRKYSPLCMENTLQKENLSTKI